MTMHILSYTIIALLLLLLATGLLRPPSWRRLDVKTEKLLRFGCYFGFFVISISMVLHYLN